ncbi:MAG: L-threonylcarbamoyladenylate synthase [Candidatus Cryptobacteroides sp.]|nr:L-threonylcarbamoyladenylate synthase [Candidatus Cryptobacteroides sp.]MEE3466375.1 L-threonylcarbamoyladenylate synthase [Candidatus Cryptobacteroides sp.]
MKPEEILAEALRVVREGGTVLYPTDTVWGLGCDATNAAAVARIFEIKRRADSKSLVLLASDLDMVAKYVKEIPSIAVDLVEVNDAPMTIIYPGAICSETGDKWHLAASCVAADGTVGIRIPLAPWCQQLVFKLGRPLVSTSANISGEPTPQRFSDIPQEIKDAVDFVVPPSVDTASTGRASQILKVGLRGEIEIIRK